MQMCSKPNTEVHGQATVSVAGSQARDCARLSSMTVPAPPRLRPRRDRRRPRRAGGGSGRGGGGARRHRARGPGPGRRQGLHQIVRAGGHPCRAGGGVGEPPAAPRVGPRAGGPRAGLPGAVGAGPRSVAAALGGHRLRGGRPRRPGRGGAGGACRGDGDDRRRRPRPWLRVRRAGRGGRAPRPALRGLRRVAGAERGLRRNRPRPRLHPGRRRPARLLRLDADPRGGRVRLRPRGGVPRGRAADCRGLRRPARRPRRAARRAGPAGGHGAVGLRGGGSGHRPDRRRRGVAGHGGDRRRADQRPRRDRLRRPRHRRAGRRARRRSRGAGGEGPGAHLGDPRGEPRAQLAVDPGGIHAGLRPVVGRRLRAGGGDRRADSGRDRGPASTRSSPT